MHHHLIRCVQGRTPGALSMLWRAASSKSSRAVRLSRLSGRSQATSCASRRAGRKRTHAQPDSAQSVASRAEHWNPYRSLILVKHSTPTRWCRDPEYGATERRQHWQRQCRLIPKFHLEHVRRCGRTRNRNRMVVIGYPPRPSGRSGDDARSRQASRPEQRVGPGGRNVVVRQQGIVKRPPSHLHGRFK